MCTHIICCYRIADISSRVNDTSVGYNIMRVDLKVMKCIVGMQIVSLK